MKKLGLILTVVFVLCITAGCRENNKLIKIERNYEDMYVVPLTITTEKNVYSVDDTVIKYFTYNPTQEEQVYSPNSTYLQKFDDGEWKIVSFKDDGKTFYSLAYGIPSGATHEENMKLDEEFYLPLDEGLYRIVKDDTINVIISNEFEIK